jgi:Beta-propeller repeat
VSFVSVNRVRTEDFCADPGFTVSSQEDFVLKPSASKGRIYAVGVLVTATIAAALLIVSHQARSHQSRVAKSASSASSLSKTIPAAARDRLQAAYAALPLAFEPNQGQTDAQVKYMARANGYTLFLTNQDAVFAFHSKTSANQLRMSGRAAMAHASGAPVAKEKPPAVVRMRLVGENSSAQITAANQLPGKSNYYLGNDPTKWQTNVSQYARVAYKNIYPGIDLAYYGEQSKLEFDFIIAPESNAVPIDFAFSGAKQLATDASGNLIVSSAAGDVVLHKPVAYQQQNGSRQTVEARFVLKGKNQVSFDLGSYDHSRELVIDPTVTYSTYLGGLAEDDGLGIAFDSSGGAYVTGETESTNFPILGGVAPNTNVGSFDVFVTKVAADGLTLVYSTYVGGSGSDSGNFIAVDASGDAFVAGGTSSSDFPVTAGAFQKTFGGGGLDAFVFELNPGGTALSYSTYVGGTGSDVATGLALDSSGNSYIVGSTSSADFPTLNPIQKQLNGTTNGFVTKLNASGSALAYSTWLGGGTGDFTSAVALDSSGNAYVTGGTASTHFPITSGAYQTTCGSCSGGLDNAFVTVINAAGSNYVYSTYLGGADNDEGLSIAVDSSGDAYVTGMTDSSNFPIKSAYQSTYGGGLNDAFVTELNPAGAALVYSTFLGGSSAEVGTGIALDGSNHAYITGQTASSNFPVVSATQSTLGGDNDAFVTELDSTGSTSLFSTYLGGSLDENTTTSGNGPLGAIAVDGPGANIYVTGNTASTNFPVFPTTTPFQLHNGGAIDAFVIKYGQPAFSIAATSLSPASVAAGSSATSTITIASLNAFTGSVALTCTVSGPSGATSIPSCLFVPSTVTGGAGTAALTVGTTSTTTLGAYTITVTGTGPSSVQSTSLILTIAGPDFSIAATTPAAVSPGGTGSSTVTLTSIAGYASAVQLTCAVTGGGSPAPACSATGTNPVTPSSSGATSTVTITTTGASAAIVHPSKFFYAMWLPIAGMSLIGVGFSSAGSRRKKLLGFLMVAMVMAALFLMPACGSSSNSGGGGGGGGGCTGCTPAGSYTVTITGTGTDASATTHSTTVTLTVN